MKIQRTTKSHKILHKEWRKEGRLEERTCREIKNGKCFLNPKVYSLSFFIGSRKKPVGLFNYFNVNRRNQSCECGYMIDPEYRGEGIGKKMIKYCVSYLFKKYNFNKIYCQTASFNKPSVKTLKDLGFHRDGVLREHHELDGKMYADYIFSILRSEWRN